MCFVGPAWCQRVGEKRCEENQLDPNATLPICQGGIERVNGSCCRAPAEVLANYVNGKKNNLVALE